MASVDFDVGGILDNAGCSHQIAAEVGLDAEAAAIDVAGIVVDVGIIARVYRAAYSAFIDNDQGGVEQVTVLATAEDGTFD